MKLSDFLNSVNEMAVGDEDAAATQAAALINRDAPLVIAGKAKNAGAMFGPLQGALKALGKTNAPEKYVREVKLAKSALAKIDAYNKTVNTHDTPSMAAACDVDKKKK